MNESIVGILVGLGLAFTGCAGAGVGDTTELLVFNEGPLLEVGALFVTDSESELEGPNQLDGSVLGADARFAVDGVPCGRHYDVRVETVDGETIGSIERVLVECGGALEIRVTPLRGTALLDPALFVETPEPVVEAPANLDEPVLRGDLELGSALDWDGQAEVRGSYEPPQFID